jgi:hypothetical protein
MRIMVRIVLSMLAAAALAACASIPLKTVYNLWNFDPWTSDFRQWRAAVRLPEGRGLALDAARVQMKVDHWREGDAARQSEIFILERSLDAGDIAPLAAEKRPGFALAAFRFAAVDYARMEALRTRIVAAKKTGQPVKGALSISASSCSGGKAAAVEGAYPFSSYLMVDVKDGYNPLLVDYDLGPELRKAAAKGELSDVCKVGK